MGVDEVSTEFAIRAEVEQNGVAYPVQTGFPERNHIDVITDNEPLVELAYAFEISH